MNRNTIQEFIDELYFGQYCLEDLRMLPDMKREYLSEHIQKMIDELDKKFNKYGDSPILFGVMKK